MPRLHRAETPGDDGSSTCKRPRLLQPAVQALGRMPTHAYADVNACCFRCGWPYGLLSRHLRQLSRYLQQLWQRPGTSWSHSRSSCSPADACSCSQISRAVKRNRRPNGRLLVFRIHLAMPSQQSRKCSAAEPEDEMRSRSNYSPITLNFSLSAALGRWTTRFSS
jgi:hypothetical protein